MKSQLPVRLYAVHSVYPGVILRHLQSGSFSSIQYFETPEGEALRPLRLNRLFVLSGSVDGE
jgi:hypothetical protein